MDANIQKIKEYFENNNIKPSCKVVTFGCQMNAKDSEKLLGILKCCGFNEIDNEELADFVIFNTCTVRENANQKLYGHIGQLKKSYLENKNKIIAICGCMMQEEDEVENIKNKYPYVKMIFGTHNLFNFPTYLYDTIVNKKKVFEILKDTNKIVENLPTQRKFSYKCGVNISFGCDNFCTYCIVPYVRGREKSRHSEDILREVNELVNDNVKEIMLLGQNVNSYGNDFRKNNIKEFSFSELLEKISQIEGLKRVRFMTSHPKDLSIDLINVIKNNKKIARHIHLPVQSGSNRILNLMNRKYTREYYLDLVDKIYSNIPDVALTTDIIVGFPTETEDDFNDTLDLIKKCKFSQVFTFEYSKRTGTKASLMDGQIDKNIVKDRFNKLLSVVDEYSKLFSNKLVGKIFEGFVEEVDVVDGFMSARLSNNFLVHFKAPKEILGTFVNLKLIESKGFYFIGELV